MSGHRNGPRLAAFCLGLVAALVPPLPAPATQASGTRAAMASDGVVRLSLPQARALAQMALRKAQPRTTLALTEGLLAADPDSGHAHFLRAGAFGQLGDYRTGRKEAARAFRVARTDVQRFEAARLAAQLSFADERLTVSQLWLRRAVHYAPSEELRRKQVEDFRNVRASNPFHFDLRFSISPSDNVNNGANSPYNLIEGSPLVGTLSPSAQAISGVVAKTDIRTGWRLRQGEGFETHLAGRALSHEVRFNDPVPGISGDDISSLRAQIGLRHLWAPGENGYWRFDLFGGRAWYARAPFYDFAGLGLRRVQRLGEDLQLSLGTEIERQFDKTAPRADATALSAFAGLGYRLGEDAELGAHLLFREIDSNGTNRAAQQWTALVSYTPGQPIGPAEISFSLGRSRLDYDQYWVITPVPGGRIDDSWFGTITASFTDLGYMGFVPVLSVTAEKSRSNISRFNVDQTSVAFGIQSEF